MPSTSQMCHSSHVKKRERLSLQQGTHLNCIFKYPVFSLSNRKFSVPIYIICEYYIHRTDLADLSSFWKKMDFFVWQLSQYPLRLESEHLQLELTNFPVFSLCLDKIPCVLTKFPNSLFSLTGNLFGHFPCNQSVFPATSL